jgi:hypothetical protein
LFAPYFLFVLFATIRRQLHRFRAAVSINVFRRLRGDRRPVVVFLGVAAK